MEISPRVQALLPQLIEDRRALHRIPELGDDLSATRAYLLDQLRALAPDELRPCGQAGIRAVFRSPAARSAPAVGFRADMDALAVAERTQHAFPSQHPGRMHACGHDGHMAALLGLARLVSAGRARLMQDVVLLFQPSEETTGGALRMVEDGALEAPRVANVFGMHLMPDVPLGRIGLKPGPLMASACELDIDIEGRSAHGAQPHQGADAVTAMAHLIALVQTALTRLKDPMRPAVLTIGRVEAGSLRNVIAAHAHLECTLRTFDEPTVERVKQLIGRCLDSVDGLFGTKSALSQRVYYPPVVNPPELTARVAELAGGRLFEVEARTIAEDFSQFQRAAPSVFFFCGVGDAEHAAPLHADTFDFDERALLTGLELFSRLIGWADEPKNGKGTN